jgi:hypothetical protein
MGEINGEQVLETVDVSDNERDVPDLLSMWPAYSNRARLFAKQHQWQAALHDLETTKTAGLALMQFLILDSYF